jgi:hypothetical protein
MSHRSAVGSRAIGTGKPLETMMLVGAGLAPMLVT